jgi:hypothetical protein
MDWGAIIQAATAASQVASQAAAARAQGRAAQATLQQGQDRTAQTGYQTDKSLDLSALNSAYQAALSRGSGILSEQAANLAAPGKRAANSVRGDLLANLQDASISRPGGVPNISVSGGLRPSLLSGNSRALGAAMSRQALLNQMAPEATPFSDLKPLDVSSITNRKAPAPTPLPQSSTLDTILSNLGLYGSMAGAVAPALRQQSPWTETRGDKTTPSGD